MKFPQRGPKEAPYNGFNEMGFPVSKRDHPAYGYTPKGTPVHGYNEAGQPICGRKIIGKDAVCQSTLCSNETGRCAARGHGGSPNRSGPAIKHGQRSVFLQNLNLAGKFQAALKDTELISHRKNAALLEVLKAEELEGALPPAELWQKALDLYNRSLTGDTGALRELGPILSSGLDTANRIDRAVELAEKQRKHIDSEVKRETDLQTTLNIREANAFTMAMACAVLDAFSDLRRAANAGIPITERLLQAAQARIAVQTARLMS